MIKTLIFQVVFFGNVTFIREFLGLSMKRFCFSDDFIHCIQGLYSSPTARIKVNCSLSNSLTLCRQVCPVSPNLFSSLIEHLAQAVRKKTELKAKSIGVECNLCLCANNVLVSKSGMPLLMKMLETYGVFSVCP